MQKAITEFLVATVPLVLVYFIGWGYLYFYFNAFGINISEIHLDTSTVFIYALTPIEIVLGPAIFVIATAVVLFGVTLKLLPPDIKMQVQAIRMWLTDGLAPGIKIAMFTVGLAIALIFLQPILKWAAQQKQMKIWVGQAEVIVPLVDSPGDDKDKAGTLIDPAWRRQRESYVQCRNAQALRLIFADDKAYYALCKSREDEVGIVFEVRREGGLTSARFASPEK
jgi:hypothetical protein